MIKILFFDIKYITKMLCMLTRFVIRINSVWIKLVIFLNIGNKKK